VRTGAARTSLQQLVAVDAASGRRHEPTSSFRFRHAALGKLQDNPDFQAGVRISAASNAIAGRPEEARRTVVRLQRLNPTLRVSNLRHVLGHYQRADDLARYEEGLRKAGLPE
jgi:adenylate cyclase